MGPLTWAVRGAPVVEREEEEEEEMEEEQVVEIYLLAVGGYAVDGVGECFCVV